MSETTDKIYEYTSRNIEKAAEIIRNGGLVAFPTETVYGLGANVYNSKAVANIFAAKNRPFFDPLISHIADINFLERYAKVDQKVMALAQKFWPGPLTFVLNRIEEDPRIDLACSGLRTVTVRMPRHPVALDLIKASGVPIVAPSANRYQSISPTTAKHVADGLGDSVDMILDGGACTVGVESTILDLTSEKPVILRAGGTTKEAIEEFLGTTIEISSGNPNQPTAPGQLLRHYAPQKKLSINVNNPSEDEFFIGFGNLDGHLNLSKSGSLSEAASNLFAFLRAADSQKQYPKIAVAPIPTTGLGLAINDRLIRASHSR